MKIQIASDLHLEFLSIKQVIRLADKLSYETNAQTLILAGDICSLSNTCNYKLHTFLNVLEDKYKNIIYVLGNHEYYGSSRQEVKEELDKIVKYRQNLYILDNSSVVLGDSTSIITLYGTTLWFEETVEANLKRYSLNDYRQIKNFTPDLWCRKAISYIKQIPEDSNKRVLITHHVPHSRFISPKYVGNELNCFYLNEIGKYLNKFDLVTFGHSHESVTYQFSDRTLAISNPRGYIDSFSNEGSNDKFNYQLIVEV